MLRPDTIAAELYNLLLMLIEFDREYERKLAADLEQSRSEAELEAPQGGPVENSAPVEYKCKWRVIE